MPEGFSFVLKNRNVREPYEVTGVFVVDQWRKIGLNVTHTPQEGGPYFNDFRQGNYDVGIDFMCEFMDEPDLYLLKYSEQRQEPDQLCALQRSESSMNSTNGRAACSISKIACQLLRQIEKRVLGRTSLSVSGSMVAAHRAAQRTAQGLEDRSEPLCESRFARCLAGTIAGSEGGSRIEDGRSRIEKR